MMSKISKVSLVVFVVLLIGLSFWGVSIFKDRNSTSPSSQNSEDQSDSSTEESGDDQKTDASLDEVDSDSEDGAVSEPVGGLLDVSEKECNDQCKSFENDPEDLKYCREVCGLALPNPIANGCDAIEDDLEKDYCLKDLAIKKNEMKICDQIADSNIKKTCRNRILEDIVDKQMLEQ
ncbi:MAG: hypothetical protein ACD_8C00050G0007 [uncultured bacterium]|nr:MAG: hypothetical protein ACD_8C00050G0007 [uncultured bacterium]